MSAYVVKRDKAFDAQELGIRAKFLLLCKPRGMLHSTPTGSMK